VSVSSDAVAETREPRNEPQPVGNRLGRAATSIRGLAIDVSPLRDSRDFRVLWIGELVSQVGRQITVVALPFQIFVLTRSAFAVGLIGLAQLLPLMLVSIGLGHVVDRVDRRKLILFTEAGVAGATGLLLAGALAGHPPVAYLYAVTALQTSVAALNHPARTASVPSLVRPGQLPAALALNQVLYTSSMVIGPAIAGLIVAKLGFAWAYGIDLASTGAAMWAASLLRPLPPRRVDGVRASALADIREGFAHVRRHQVLLSTFLIDLDAMIFGMPRALFPILALTVFHVGPSGVGLLYAAPAAGALLGALTTGWVGRVRRQGLAVVSAVVLWGAAITGFGLFGRVFWLGLLFLAAAGAADVISAVFRGTILQLSVPDSLRGRLSSIHIMVVTGGPRLGDFEAGTVASLVSPLFSVISGGIACVVGALLLALAIPELRQYAVEPETLEGAN
jgi:predicted MFS family arabinose efflux permease